MFFLFAHSLRTFAHNQLVCFSFPFFARLFSDRCTLAERPVKKVACGGCRVKFRKDRYATKFKKRNGTVTVPSWKILLPVVAALAGFWCFFEGGISASLKRVATLWCACEIWAR